MRRLAVWAVVAVLLAGQAACDGDGDGAGAGADGQSDETEIDTTTEALALISAVGIPEPPAARVVGAARAAAGNTEVAYASSATAAALRAAFEAGQGQGEGGYTVTEVLARAAGGFTIHFTQGGRAGTVSMGAAAGAGGSTGGSGGGRRPVRRGATTSTATAPAGAPAGTVIEITFLIIVLEPGGRDEVLIRQTVQRRGAQPTDYEADFDEAIFRKEFFATIDAAAAVAPDYDFGTFFEGGALAREDFGAAFTAEMAFDEAAFFAALEAEGFLLDEFFDDPLFADEDYFYLEDLLGEEYYDYGDEGFYDDGSGYTDDTSGFDDGSGYTDDTSGFDDGSGYTDDGSGYTDDTSGFDDGSGGDEGF